VGDGRRVSSLDEQVAAFSAGERFFFASPDPLLATDAQGRILVVNPAWRRLFELGEGDAEPAVHHGDRPQFLAFTAQAAGEGAGGEADVRFVGPRGDQRLIRLRMLFAEPGGVVCLRARDITVERRRATHADLVERITGVGSWEIDIATGALFWSPQTYHIHEMAPGGPRPRLEDGLSFYPAEARAVLEPAVTALMDRGVGYDVELAFVTAKGRRRWVRVNAVGETRDGQVIRVHGSIEDVTEQRLRHAQLRRLAAFAAMATNGCIICGVDRRIEWVNPAFTTMSGYTLDEAIGHSPGALLQCEETDPDTVAAIREALDAGRDVCVDILNRAKSGTPFWLRLDIHPLRDDAGALTGFIANQTDITALKENERRLRAAERAAEEARQRLLNAIAAMGDGFALYDADDRLVLCNDRYRAFYPRSAPLMRPGARFEDMLRAGLARGEYEIGGEDPEAWVRRRMARRRQGAENIEQQVTGGRWLRGIDRRTPDGGTVALRVDVTELKRERMRLADIIDATRIATWEFDCATGGATVNGRLAEILGHPPGSMDDVDQAFLRSLVHPDDAPDLAAARAAHERGETDLLSREIRLRGANGWRWVLVRGRVGARDADGAPLTVSGMYLDIQDQKDQEAALHEARVRAEQASATKSQFLANMSHEIRTPMNGVLGMAQMLDARLTDPEDRRLLRIIRESGEALLTVINDILDFSKIEAGKLDIEAAPFVPGDVARRVESLHAMKAEEKHLGFAMRVIGDPDAPRIGDSHRLLQILHNLVGNAVKFTETGQVAATLDVTPDDAIALTIDDTGVGMTPAQQAAVFQDFVQADASTTRRYGGTGLGMAIVRRLVAAMGGEIALDSAPGEGTTVRVSLPLRRAEAGECAPPAEAPPETGGQVAGAAVLAVDDNEVNRMVLEAQLSALGVRATLACGGREAVDLCAARRFDAVLMDVSMPDMDGRAALAAIRAAEAAAGLPRTPVLAVTAHALRHQIEAFLAQGFDGHVPKPVRADALRAALCAALRGAG